MPIYYDRNCGLGFQILRKCIAFHSYKGGTGKTTLAANFAALLAKKGYKVFLLDFDVYAPSLQSYFEIDPKKWINDFLFEKAELEEVLMDLTPLIEGGEGSGQLSRNRYDVHENGMVPRDTYNLIEPSSEGDELVSRQVQWLVDRCLEKGYIEPGDDCRIITAWSSTP